MLAIRALRNAESALRREAKGRCGACGRLGVGCPTCPLSCSSGFLSSAGCSGISLSISPLSAPAPGSPPAVFNFPCFFLYVTAWSPRFSPIFFPSAPPSLLPCLPSLPSLSGCLSLCLSPPPPCRPLWKMIWDPAKPRGKVRAPCGDQHRLPLTCHPRLQRGEQRGSGRARMCSHWRWDISAAADN